MGVPFSYISGQAVRTDKHKAVMAVTRAASARAQAISDNNNESFSTPRKTLPTPSLSRTSAQLKVLTAPSSKTQTPSSSIYVCSACGSSSELRQLISSNSSSISKLTEAFQTFSVKINDMNLNFETKIEHIGSRIKEIEASITDNMALINDLERDISRVASVSNNNNNDNNINCSQRNHESLQPHILPVSNANTITERTACGSRYRNKPSLLILGDSNTKYVKLSGAYDIRRVPTFLIQDVDPSQCGGYDRVWLHVGTNNLKYSRCNNYSDVKSIFKIFMNKLSAIRNLYPIIKIYVSPILPSGIPGLNTRACWFNRMLFSVKNIWWNELSFSSFCCSETGLLDYHLRSYRNRSDKIHLGVKGIKALENALLREINKVDNRFYSSVVKNSRTLVV